MLLDVLPKYQNNPSTTKTIKDVCWIIQPFLPFQYQKKKNKLAKLP